MGKKLISKHLTCSLSQTLNNESTNPEFLSQNLLYADWFKTEFNSGIKISKKICHITTYFLTQIRQFTAL